MFVDQFIASFAQPPITLTFDFDAVDDPTHGSQQLTLFHGFYKQYQYLPLVIACAENDQIVMISLRHGTAAASLGADDDLTHLVKRIREVWPNMRIRVRGDGGPLGQASQILAFGSGRGQRRLLHRIRSQRPDEVLFAEVSRIAESNAFQTDILLPPNMS